MMPSFHQHTTTAARAGGGRQSALFPSPSFPTLFSSSMVALLAVSITPVGFLFGGGGLGVGVVVGAAASAAPLPLPDRSVPVRVCANAYSAGYMYHVDYASRYFSASYTETGGGGGGDPLGSVLWPSLNVTLAQSISPTLANRNLPIEMVRAFVRQGGDERCDLYLGPSWSDASVALSPLMERPMWVDPGSSTSLLTNKKLYPAYLRVVPSDDQLAPKLTELLTLFGWRDVFLLKGDSAYANSWSNAFSAAHLATGGRVVQTFTVPKFSATEDDVAALLFGLKRRARESRIIVAADVPFDLMNAVFERYGLGNDLIVVYSMQACSDGTYAWDHLPGAFCMTMGNDVALYDEYVAKFKARDAATLIPPLLPQLEQMGYDPSALLLPSSPLRDEFDVFMALTVDALWYGLTVLQQYATAHGGALPANSVESCAFARASNVSIKGLTGEVRLNADGDRNGFIADLLNSGMTQGSASVGTADASGVITFSLGSVVMLGRSYDLRGLSPAQILLVVPTDRHVDPLSLDNSDAAKTAVAIAVPLVVAALLALGALAAFIIFRRRGGRRVGAAIHYAPKDPLVPIAILFTDIQSSTALWAECPAEMSAALDLHNRMIRRCIGSHNGYEVKTIGDSFMIAFGSALDAAACSMAIQQDLFSSSWDPLAASFASNGGRGGGKRAKRAAAKLIVTQSTSEDEERAGGDEEEGASPASDAEEGGRSGGGSRQRIAEAINNFYKCSVDAAIAYMGLDTAEADDDENNGGAGAEKAYPSAYNNGAAPSSSVHGSDGVYSFATPLPTNASLQPHHRTGGGGGGATSSHALTILPTPPPGQGLGTAMHLASDGHSVGRATVTSTAYGGGGQPSPNQFHHNHNTTEASTAGNEHNAVTTEIAATLPTYEVSSSTAAANGNGNGGQKGRNNINNNNNAHASLSDRAHWLQNGLRVRIGATYGVCSIRASVRDRRSGHNRVLSDAETAAIAAAFALEAPSTTTSYRRGGGGPIGISAATARGIFGDATTASHHPTTSSSHVHHHHLHTNNNNSGSSEERLLIDLDAVAFDYFGPCVNTAARIEAVGHGGQTIASAELFAAAMAEAEGIAGSAAGNEGTLYRVLDDDTQMKQRHQQRRATNSIAAQQTPNNNIATSTAAVRIDTSDRPAVAAALVAWQSPLGRVPLRGLAAPVALVQIAPPLLAGRAFLPLRLEHNHTAIGTDGAGVFPPIFGDNPDGAADCSSAAGGSDVLSSYKEAGSRSNSSHHLRRQQQQHNPNAAYKKASSPGRGSGGLLDRYFADMCLTQQVAARRRVREPDLRLGYFVIEALLSVLPPRESSALVRSLAERWRVDATAEAEGLFTFGSRPPQQQQQRNASDAAAAAIGPLGAAAEKVEGGGSAYGGTTTVGGGSSAAISGFGGGGLRPTPARASDGLRRVLIASRIVPVAVSRAAQAPAAVGINQQSSLGIQQSSRPSALTVPVPITGVGSRRALGSSATSSIAGAGASHTK